MMRFKPNWQAVLAFIALVLSVFNLPFTAAATTSVTVVIVMLIAAAALASCTGGSKPSSIFLFAALTHVAVFLLIGTISGAEGTASKGFFAALAACWLMAWRLVTVLSGDGSRRSGNVLVGRVLVPTLFGLWILILWEAITRGAGIPFVLLPPPSAIGAKIMTSLPILAADFRQTVLKAMIFGFVVGSGAGFVVAILADRFRFLSNGLLPIGNLVSALPIIGVAPVMVIWFGFDWQSKAAVVIIMTFFPMLVNTIEGLKSAGHMERDLMRTYGSSHWQTLFKLRLPAAMPFVFNALKINSTLALIGALVSEFFGTPIVGMGFRISTEVGRMNLDMVWAEIALAAVVGSLFYGALALLERVTTFWHPSYR
ncbi:ABC transporter permease [Rhizobium sp. KVB221]|uniref:ABC transporter permease n=1 Tax=Rhizobium setariae TaxID=2801340 RepID=A0A936YRT6_9HYPH|nr:ABC transporter permease [Rhizobium setariae]MBL0374508.1 ABC transporter permease [Rhizobium setariae]